MEPLLALRFLRGRGRWLSWPVGRMALMQGLRRRWTVVVHGGLQEQQRLVREDL